MSAVILHCVAVAVAFRLSVSQHGGKQAAVAQRRGQKRCTLPPPAFRFASLLSQIGKKRVFFFWFYRLYYR